jgi:hypothetical protein
MIHLRENYWAYPMPKAEGAEIRGEHPGRPYQLLSFYGEADAVDLPPGTWEIVCTSKEATSDKVIDLVDSVDSEGRGLIFMNYKNGMYVFGSPLSSLRTLLTSKGCDLNKNWLILKKTV